MLSNEGIYHYVCVASEYGSDVMEKTDFAAVHIGRMDADAMVSYLVSNGFGTGDTIVDATHPYAVDAGINICEAAKRLSCTYIRVSRPKDAPGDKGSLASQTAFYDSMKDFARKAGYLGGNILLTTGSRQLPDYCSNVSMETLARTYVRVLPTDESLKICEDNGIGSMHIICMHGPFSAELNAAIMRQYDIRHMLTKDSGAAGGYDEKIEAARMADVVVHVIKRPDESAGEYGISVDEAFERITGKKHVKRRKIVLAGIGPGGADTMTREVYEAIRGCCAVFGAKPVVSAALSAVFGSVLACEKPVFELYLAKDIIPVLEKEDITDAVIVFSGDSGFYSGAKKCFDTICRWDEDAEVSILPGVSSVSALAARLKESYDDADVVSIHGKNGGSAITDLALRIGRGAKTFVLLSSDEDLRALAKELMAQGIEADVKAGCDLSLMPSSVSDGESIISLTLQEAAGFYRKGKITALFINCSPGHTDPTEEEAEHAGTEHEKPEQTKYRHAEPADVTGSGRIMIAAPASSSGKTVVTIGLLYALKERGIDLRAFKCGPDYIDPMFHRTVLGIDSHNLDTYLMGADGVRAILDGSPAAVIEGVMGLYDGLTPDSVAGSGYEIAKITATPVILVVNASGAGRTVISLIKGVLADDEAGLIRGIILNRISDAFYEKLLPTLEKEILAVRPDVAIYGHIPKTDAADIDSRHLGLALPNEIEDIRDRIRRIAQIIEENCDIEAIQEIISGSNRSEPGISNKFDKDPTVYEDEAGEYLPSDTVKLQGAGAKCFRENTMRGPALSRRILTAYVPLRPNSSESAFSREYLCAAPLSEAQIISQPILAIARDEAFCFYYPENITFLESAGFDIRYFSPVHDDKLPDGTCAILLGGGYPELYLESLSANRKMLSSVRSAIERGVPSAAECGGFMYLHRMIADKEGREYEMAGIIDGKCTYTGHLVNFGYMSIKGAAKGHENGADSLSGMRGHEFHYYGSTSPGDDLILGKFSTKKLYEGMYASDRHLWGWPHLYYPSCEKMAGIVADLIASMV